MINGLVFPFEIKDVSADSLTSSLAMKAYTCFLRPVPILPCLSPSISRGANGFRIPVTFRDLS